jgi:hypothetical protein
MTARCCCPACLARTVTRARIWIVRRRPELACEILANVLRDLDCDVSCAGDSYVRHLEAQLSEYQGWTRAYHAEERQRVAPGDRCPCLAGARR